VGYPLGMPHERDIPLIIFK